MSRLTENLLNGIDYKKINTIRTNNFSILHNEFSEINKLKLTVPEGAFMYPLYVENGYTIRKALQQQNIFIPTLWPSVFEKSNIDDLMYDMAKNILPIPIDQRYGIDDINYLIGEIQKCID